MFGTQIPMYRVDARTYLFAVLLCLLMGLVGGAAPALQAMRMRAIEALRRGV